MWPRVATSALSTSPPGRSVPPRLLATFPAEPTTLPLQGPQTVPPVALHPGVKVQRAPGGPQSWRLDQESEGLALRREGFSARSSIPRVYPGSPGPGVRGLGPLQVLCPFSRPLAQPGPPRPGPPPPASGHLPCSQRGRLGPSNTLEPGGRQGLVIQGGGAFTDPLPGCQP